MEVFKFIRKAMRAQFSPWYIFEITGKRIAWKTWWRYADLTRLVNYRCDFDGESCVRQREQEEDRKAKKKPRRGAMSPVYTTSMCCCEQCADELGYIRVLPKDIEVIKRIARYFSEKTGFWREGRGCVLPRRYRSVTCLGFSCKQPEPKGSSDLVRILRGSAFLDRDSKVPTPEQMRKLLLRKEKVCR